MTPLRLIAEATTQFTSYPWTVMLTHQPQLQKELDRVVKFIQITGSDPLAGLKFQGISQLIPNLTYL